MRVWHSAWSWLNEIVPLDSVAGNTLIGMFTRLILRKPFQVARAAIQGVYRTLDFVSFVPVTEIEAGTGEVDVVAADFLAEELPRRAVILDGHDETACKIA